MLGRERPGAGDAGPQNGGRSNTWTRLNYQPPAPISSAPLFAELIGTACTAAGVTTRGPTPVLALCRELIAAGLDPDQALDVYRSATLALRVRSIGEAAALTVVDDSRGTPRLAKYRPGPAERGRVARGKAPPVRSNGSTYAELAADAEWQPWPPEGSGE